MEFINDYGADYSAAVVIADFLDQLRANNYEIKTLKVAFPPIIGRRHNSNEDGYKDFERCLKIVDLGKQRGLQFYIDEVDRLKTPYHSLFEELNKWSSNRKT